MIRSGEGFGSQAPVGVDAKQRGEEWSSALRSGFGLTDKAIEGLTANAELSGDLGLGLSRSNAAPQLFEPIRAERPAASPVDATLLRKGDPLTLPLSDERTLELGHCSHYRQHEGRHGRVPAGKGQVSPCPKGTRSLAPGRCKTAE